MSGACTCFFTWLSPEAALGGEDYCHQDLLGVPSGKKVFPKVPSIPVSLPSTGHPQICGPLTNHFTEEERRHGDLEAWLRNYQASEAQS
jgi:hypothetical protein